MIETVDILTRSAVDADMILTLDEAKAYLNIYHDADDQLITDLVQDALDIVESGSSALLRSATGIVRLSCWRECVTFDKRPVTAISSVQYYDADDQLQTVSTGDYVLEGTEMRPGMRISSSYSYLTLSSDRSRPIEIRLTLGYTRSTVERRIRQAVRYYVNTMYTHRDDPTREKQTAADRLMQTIKAYYL